MQSYICAYRCICIHAYIHSHVYLATYIHIYKCVDTNILPHGCVSTSGCQVPIFSYFFSKFLFSPIFQQNSYFFLLFSQFAVEFFISGFFFRFYFFQCGNTCTERAVLWENFSHGVVWVRFSHKSLTNVWRSVDLTSPHPG